MKYGQRKHRLRIERATDTANDSGQPIRTWSTLYASLPAAVESVSQYEQDASKKQAARSVVVFETQYLSGITTKDRVIWLTDGNRTLGITGVIDPTADRRVLQWTCEEAV